jgi:hypothetical protein
MKRKEHDCSLQDLPRRDCQLETSFVEAGQNVARNMFQAIAQSPGFSIIYSSKPDAPRAAPVECH